MKTLTEYNNYYLLQIDLSHEQIFSAQAPDFVAVKNTDGPCLGCPFDLNLNAAGTSELVETALRHVESEREEKHTALRVIRLQEQVSFYLRF